MRKLFFALIGAVFAFATDAAAQSQLDQSFRDCADCPEMVLVPAGSFLMGSPESDRERMNQEAGPRGSLSFLLDRESPQRSIAISSFAVGRFEVTVEEFSAFVHATGASDGQDCISDQDSDLRWEWSGPGTWRRPGFAQGDRDPVVCVSWKDAHQYVALAKYTCRRWLQAAHRLRMGIYCARRVKHALRVGRVGRRRLQVRQCW